MYGCLVIIRYGKTAMDLDLDTFLTTVYCVVDDLYQEHFAGLKPVRPGAAPELSDSEVVTLALLAQWQARRSESQFVAYAAAHWRRYFPRLLDPSAFNRRVRDVLGVLSALGPRIAALTQRTFDLRSPYEVVDGVPIPLERRCRGNRHRLFAEEVGIGRGGSDKTWFYGVRLLALVDPHGLITGFMIGPAATEERWLVEALLRWREDPTAPVPTAADLAEVLGPAHRRHGERTGPTGRLGPRSGVGVPTGALLLGDNGHAGREWSEHWRRDYGVTIMTPRSYADLAERKERRRAVHALKSLRQVVETVFNGLTERLGATFPKARSAWGLYARLAAKVAASNVAIYVNHLFNRPTFAFFDPLTA